MVKKGVIVPMRSIDSILISKLGRKAVETTLVQRSGRPAAANFLRDVLEEIERLAESCQLTEFTEHGLPHLGSLVDRIDAWERQGGAPLLDSITTDEAFLLLFAVLSHDIGMIAQIEDDLSEEERLHFAREYADLPGWVRRTHVPRLEGIVRRLLSEKYPEFVGNAVFQLGCSLARSHNFWPHETGYQQLEDLALQVKLDPTRVKALAGILALCDLLDEDSGRCDSMTLFANKAGNLMNRAHWLRHWLTVDRLRVVDGKVSVPIRVPQNLKGKIDAALGGLRNHLRCAQVYNPVLKPLGAEVTVQFPPVQDAEEVPVRTSLALLLADPEVHLLRTIDRGALPAADANNPPGSMVPVMGVDLERIDLRIFEAALKGGQHDLEITYAAAVARGEPARLKAIELIRTAVLDHDVRGDIASVRRFSLLVLKEIGANGRPFVSDGFWAPVFAVHWAHNEADLRSVDGALMRHPVAGSGADSLQHLPLKWRVPALSAGLLLRRRAADWPVVLDLMRNRADLADAPFSYEELIAWHDLVEALWATGYLANNVPAEFWQLFADLQAVERRHSPRAQRVLSELAWRMAVQAHCLTGFGRWETAPHSQSRSDYGLRHDKSREALAELWVAWFHESGDVATNAKKAREANPGGYELHAAAAEVLWLADRYSNDVEYHQATEEDPVSQLVARVVTTLLDTRLEPRKEGTVYFGRRGEIGLRPAALLGERLALRRWMVGSWHRVVGASLQANLTVAHTLQLEGDRMPQLVLAGVVDLAWSKPFGGKSDKLLEELLPKLEPLLTAEELKPMLDAIARSPRRIGNIRHPSLHVLTDAITSDMLPVLADWTNRELAEPMDGSWPDTFTVWAGLLEHISLPPELWERLSPLLDYSLRFVHMGEASKKIVEAALTVAPWPVAARVVTEITGALGSDETDKDWVYEAKAVTGNALIRRTQDDWRGTSEYKALITVLERIRAASGDPGDKTLIDFISGDQPAEGYDGVAEQWMHHLEEARDKAVNRTGTGEYSFFGLGGYPIGRSRPISDEMAQRAAQALSDVWTAFDPTSEEVETAAKTAGLLFRASSGIGRVALVRAILTAMENQRLAMNLADREDSSYWAWYCTANHSAHFPVESLANLATVVQKRLLDLPLRVAWAQARYAMELVVRGDSSMLREAGYRSLLVLRARTYDLPRWGAEAFVGAATRLLESEGWSPDLSHVLDLVVNWASSVAGAPQAHLRESVARICLQLSLRCSPELTTRLEAPIAQLRRDIRLRVRQAAGVKEE